MLLVPPLITRDLWQPIRSVRLWFAATISALAAAVPEAAIHKNANLPTREYDIRLAWE